MRIPFSIAIAFLMASHLQGQNRGANPMAAAQSQMMYNKVYDARYVEKPPVFMAGADSIKRFYYFHFERLDSIVSKAVNNGDTAKYIRIYFSFIVDKNGSAYDAKFTRIASTRYAGSNGAKTIKYFFEDKAPYQAAVKKMIQQMPFWKPALQNMVPVNCEMEDYFQFWIGINPPAY